MFSLLSCHESTVLLWDPTAHCTLTAVACCVATEFIQMNSSWRCPHFCTYSMSSMHSKLLLMCIMCSCGLNALETELDWPQANSSSCCHVVIKPRLLFHITGRLQLSAGSSHVLLLSAAVQKSCSSESTRAVRMKLKMLTLIKNFYEDVKIRAGQEFI